MSGAELGGAEVIDLHAEMIRRRMWDRLCAIRMRGRGEVVLHDVAIIESRERPGQMRIQRGWKS